MTGRLLRAAHRSDRSEWLRRWSSAGCEPFAHPDFVQLFTKENEEAGCFAALSSEAIVPLILRPLSTSSADEAFDATSPYGYGGPFGGSIQDRSAVLHELERWARTASAVSIFVRLSLDASIAVGVEENAAVVATARNVRVDLTRGEAQVWRDYDPKVRKNVNKARRNGCTVVTSNRRPEEFLPIYASTMSRRGAAGRYRFGEQFFDRLDASDWGVRYYTVLDGGGRPVSVEVVLISDENIYSFLGGTLAEAFPLAPNDLLKHQIIRDGLDSHQRWFVLGGGYADGDGIYRYKRSFDRAGVVDFCTYRMVCDRRAFASQRGLEVNQIDWSSELTAPYFPSYRR